MLNNQPMQEYSERFPIRLLSLPTEQQHMIKRLKMAKQTHKRSQTETSSPQRYPIAASQLSSYRVHTQHMDSYLSHKKATPTQVSVDLRSTIHSKGQKQGQRRKLSILDDVPSRGKLGVLKELMAKNTPFTLSKYPRTPSETIKLQAIQPKNISSFPKAYHSKLQKSRKQRQLRNILIINRVRQTRDLNTVIRKISSSKMVAL